MPRRISKADRYVTALTRLGYTERFRLPKAIDGAPGTRVFFREHPSPSYFWVGEKGSLRWGSARSQEASMKASAEVAQHLLDIELGSAPAASWAPPRRLILPA